MAQALKVAHRGASGYESENTLASFKKAIDVAADMIELDVRACKSGELVVIHDETVDRTTDGSGRVEDKTLTELKSLKGKKGERIPTLTEALDFIDKKLKVDIELKVKNIASQACNIIGRYIEENGWSYDDFIVSSFHHNELRELKKIDPEIKIGVLSKEVPAGFLNFAKKIKAYSVNTPVDKIDEKFVEHAHKKGLKVFVFAANNTDEIQKAKDLNIDYICSDFPNKI